ncbi:MAG: InlB B-repeat-containing protein [Lachnospiraceae bacterium]|nr:InlB B-repeat-containing protein [Lachnospiraceae bacterium]
MKIKHNIFKALLLFLFCFCIIGLTKFDAQACKTGVCYKDGISGNAYWKCPCGGASNPCVPGCQGHHFTGPINYVLVASYGGYSETCTTNGKKPTLKYEAYQYCEYCHRSENVNRPKTDGGEVIPAHGHSFTQGNWSHDSTNHWINCGYGCGSRVANNYEASIYNRATYSINHTERHYEDGGHMGDHYWYYNCGANCGVGTIKSGYNATSVTVYYPDNLTYSGYNGHDRSAQSWPYLTVPAYTNNGYHVYGLHSSNGGNTVKFHHVNQTTGDRPATKNGIVIVIDGKTYTAPLCSFNTAAHGYDICAGHYGRGGTVYSGLSADVEYNFVTVNYRTGYYGDEILRTRYVDTTQTLTTEDCTLIPNRQGYDVADNGWFTSYANTYLVNTSFCNHNSGYDNYKTKHRMHFVEDYGRMYRFNTNYGPTYYNDAVATTAYTTRDLYPRWRAHALVVNYDTNGGTNKPASQTMYYSDGKSYNEQGRPTKYNLTQTVPTRTGYTFMGWGNAARWDNCTSGTKAYDVYGELNEQTRYSYSASPQAGYYEDYNGSAFESAFFIAEKKCAHNKVRA